MYPVHGGAVAFYGGKFWVFGGSTGDDSYDHTITDKVSVHRASVMKIKKKVYNYISSGFHFFFFMICTVYMCLVNNNNSNSIIPY